MTTYRVGDTVVYRGNFGLGYHRTAKIERIELCEGWSTKYGRLVSSVDDSDLKYGGVVFDLNDEHWCRGPQILGKISS